MPTALSLRRDAELKYDGPIPAEVLAAIAAEEQRERDHAADGRDERAASACASGRPRSSGSPSDPSACSAR